MNNSSDSFQSVLSQVIQKLIIMLGPDLTIVRLKHVQGLRLDQNGKILAIEGIDQEIVKQLLQCFYELSPAVPQQIAPLLQEYHKVDSLLPAASQPAVPAAAFVPPTHDFPFGDHVFV